MSFHQLDVQPRKSRRRDRGRSYVCDDQTLAIAHSMHDDGMSVREVARQVFEDCYSATPQALANALLSAWRARGWEIRSQSEATAQSNRERAFRPQCSHIRQSPGNKGLRCERRCVGNDLYCWKHDPDRVAAAIKRLRTGAAA